jgi:coenzyme F420 hydrogenase subunit beta
LDIAIVVEQGLCHGCGTCAGLCPNEAVTMTIAAGLWVPKIISEKCSGCGICARVCPGYYVDFNELSKFAFREPQGDMAYSCYTGHSTDLGLRVNSASGGVASQILIYMLEKGLIDGALVTRMNPAHPLESEAFIAKTADQIIAASKSKYCPVAANSALRDILHMKGRFAVVGLPCHLHGIRKAEQLFPTLRAKIVLHLGLMCSHMVRFSGTEFVIEKMQVQRNQIRSITYRGSGWPGLMTINTALESKSIPLVGNWRSYWPVFSSFLYTPLRCTMCPDQMAELADISLGDAWLPEFRGDKLGKSILLTRTTYAESLLEAMHSAGVISLLPSSIAKVKRSQAVNLRFKKDDFHTRKALFKALNVQTPAFSPDSSGSLSLMAFLRSLFIFFSIKLSHSKRAMSVLRCFPFPLFRLYSGIYKTISIAR